MAQRKPLIPHPNNLSQLMRRDKVTQSQIAEAWGVKNGDVSQRVAGLVRITQQRAQILKEKFGWTASEIYQDLEPALIKNTLDEKLLAEAGKAIESALKKSGKKIDYAAMLAATINLYRHIMRYRENGEHIKPDVVHAELIMEKMQGELQQR